MAPNVDNSSCKIPHSLLTLVFPLVFKTPLTVFFGVLSGRLVTDLYHAQVKAASRPTTRQSQPEQFLLKNDPLCGITGGGTACELDCEILGDVYKDPACLRDCLSPSCFALLMADHARYNGVCSYKLKFRGVMNQLK